MLALRCAIDYAGADMCADFVCVYTRVGFVGIDIYVYILSCIAVYMYFVGNEMHVL